MAEEDPLCEMCTQFVTDLKTYISSDQGRAYFTNMINQVNMYGYWSCLASRQRTFAKLHSRCLPRAL